MEKMLELKNVCKTFNPGTVNEKKALTGLNLVLEHGDFATIVGSNGAGKSTMFNAITGAFFTDEGAIILDGEDITFKKEYFRSKDIGHLFQDPLLGTAPHMTIEENMALAYLRASTGKAAFLSRISKKEKQKFREHLSLLGMGLEDRMKTKVGLLSGGQRQVVTLLMCTLNMPKLLLLDEHTAALDPQTSDKIMKITNDIVKENNLTTMMITHNLNAALRTGTRTVMMDSGKVILDISGSERDGMTLNDLLEMYSQKSDKQFDNDRMLLTKDRSE